MSSPQEIVAHESDVGRPLDLDDSVSSHTGRREPSTSLSSETYMYGASPWTPPPNTPGDLRNKNIADPSSIYPRHISIIEDEYSQYDDEGYIKLPDAFEAWEGPLSEEPECSGQSSTLQTAFNLMNIYVGLGLLSKPYAVKVGGWGSLGILIIFVLLANITGKLLVRCFDKVSEQNYSYAALGRAAMGRWGAMVVMAVVVFEFGHAAVLSLCVVWQSLEALLESYVTVGVIHLITIGIILPSIWIPSYSRMSFVSALGCASSVLVVLSVIGIFCLDPDRSRVLDKPQDFPHPAHHWMHRRDLPMALGIFAVSIGGHACLPSLRADMRHPEQFDRMLDCTFAFMLLVYVAMGGVGYWYFGDSAHVLITTDFGHAFTTDILGTLINAVVVGLVALASACSIGPLMALLSQLMPMPSCIAFPDQPNETTSIQPTPFHLKRYSSHNEIAEALETQTSMLQRFWVSSLRTVLFFVVIVLAYLLESHLGFIMSISGGLCSCAVTFIFPCLFYLMLYGETLSHVQYGAILCLLMFSITLMFAILGTDLSLLVSYAKEHGQV